MVSIILWRIKKNDLNNYASYLPTKALKQVGKREKVENF